MIIVLRLHPNGRCHGCSAIGYVDEKTLLCLYCVALKINVEVRKRKLTTTLSQRFASLKEKVRQQLRDFTKG